MNTYIHTYIDARCLYRRMIVSFICKAIGHAAGKGEERRGEERKGKERKGKERKNSDPSCDLNHTPSAIRADVFSQLD